ncbi:hypothetical protein [Saccharopolyspora dendranthemae]|uniref:Uncharacterized protein n=1 Tax=Saccharopolyspora dendranthemae TaxID=1181886 RepID=A0A561U129_9PSEU|nr:hypothetical protein [Saccharopolyspora dendranthemae]TWF93040.1 hypothetical protein FHU35_16323 [Saccharopolyspora dendranthemae]
MLHDPDRWRHLHVHWHAYVEISTGAPLEEVSTRDARLSRSPVAVLSSPVAVCEWMASMTGEHAHPVTVHLLGSADDEGRNVGRIGDDRHIEHDRRENLAVLSRGHSLHAHFRRRDDRMRLWAEAVSADECWEAHHE